MARNFQIKDKMFTRHFLERLLNRYGVVLDYNEKEEIKKQIYLTEQGVPFENDEVFEIFLRHKNIRFIAVMQNRKLVTAHAGRKMPPKKFKKLCNLGRIKKN